jgi:hypothetical protein
MLSDLLLCLYAFWDYLTFHMGRLLSWFYPKTPCRSATRGRSRDTSNVTTDGPASPRGWPGAAHCGETLRGAL